MGLCHQWATAFPILREVLTHSHLGKVRSLPQWRLRNSWEKIFKLTLFTCSKLSDLTKLSLIYSFR